jgi:hypothetical protein
MPAAALKRFKWKYTFVTAMNNKHQDARQRVQSHAMEIRECPMEDDGKSIGSITLENNKA